MLAFASTSSEAKKLPIIPRPLFSSFRVGLSIDSAFLVMRHIAVRSDTLRVDSLLLLESDSVTIMGQPAYVQLQIARKRVRTLIINFHPIPGKYYWETRDTIVHYMEHFYGRGVVLNDESLTYHRWQSEDGQMEVSSSDKYTRIFIRLGKPQHSY